MIECTSHHICICQAAKMDAMKDEIERFQATTKIRKGYDELVKLRSELLEETNKMKDALDQAASVLLPHIEVKDW